MRIQPSHPGSGTHVEDFRRDSMGLQAAEVLEKGLGANCLSADHLNGTELCTETIIRLKTDLTKAQKFVDLNFPTVLLAVKNLRQGVGVNKKQSDHSSNTCAAVIASVSDKY